LPKKVKVDFIEWKLGDWAVIFTMHLLEKLILCGLILDRHDPDIPAEFRGQIGLKSLELEACYINVQALKNILSLPKELASLILYHHAEDCYLANVASDPWTPKGVYDAIAQQGTSLEKIELSQYIESHDNERFDAPHVYEKTGSDFDLSKFPKLTVYDGFYLDSSGKFKP
jgi:hypothetical protein